MKVFPPTRADFKKKPASRLAKTIRLLSNLYVLPLRFNENYSEVKCTLFHLKSLISFMICATPFCLMMIWYGLQPGFLQKFMEKKSSVYETIDFIIMNILLAMMLLPYEYLDILLSCKSWIEFPELSLDRQISVSKNIKSTIIILISFTGKYSLIHTFIISAKLLV